MCFYKKDGEAVAEVAQGGVDAPSLEQTTKVRLDGGVST